MVFFIRILYYNNYGGVAHGSQTHTALFLIIETVGLLIDNFTIGFNSIFISNSVGTHEPGVQSSTFGVVGGVVGSTGIVGGIGVLILLFYIIYIII